MNILGIETSCDETAAAVVRDDRTILSNVVFSQIEDHTPFGGVVPEIAARAHVSMIESVVDQALKDADMTLYEIDGIAATCGPGLIGGVMVGMMVAKSMAYAADKPFIAVNHLEGHALTARMTDDVAFPYLLLLVSGGHTQLLVVKGVGQYELLGTTVDDALGEAFDKSAKIMGLPFPGGPYMEKAAQQCSDVKAACECYPLPAPMVGREGMDFSFSGLKTAMRQHCVDADGTLTPQDQADLAAAFHESVLKVLKDRVGKAMEAANATHFVIAGGVAANRKLYNGLKELADAYGYTCVTPPVNLCTDNGAMIAWTGLERFRLGMEDDLNYKPRPRWPLDELTTHGQKS